MSNVNNDIYSRNAHSATASQANVHNQPPQINDSLRTMNQVKSIDSIATDQLSQLISLAETI